MTLEHRATARGKLTTMADTDKTVSTAETPWQRAVRVVGVNSAISKYSFSPAHERRAAGCPVTTDAWDDRNTMTNTDTRAALDAAIDKFARAAIDDANALGAPDEFAAAKAAWAAIAPAITAHVEAEVARRLAVAPSVEEALAAYGTAVYDLGYVLHMPDRDAVLRPVKDAAEATFRAAVAADRDRAVAAEVARGQATTFGLRARLAIVAEIADEAIASASEAPDCHEQVQDYRDRMRKWADSTRPTPDEARRLVEAYGRECELHAFDRDPNVEAALLRALGVEA